MTDHITPTHGASVTDRVRYLQENSHKSQGKFAESIGIDPSTLSKVLSGKMAATDQFCNRIVVNLGVSKDWLMTGEGVPYPRSGGPASVATGELLLTSDPKGAPVYDIDASAGCTPIDMLLTSDNITGFIELPGVSTKNPVIRVWGDSMQPRIADGAFISIRPIRDTSIIIWGATYVIQLEDYRLVKIIKPCKTDPSKVVLHSDNPAYDDVEIPRSAIVHLFQVETIINCQFIA